MVAHRLAVQVVLLVSRAAFAYREIVLTLNYGACRFNILLTRHEYQHVSLRHGQVYLQDLFDSAVNVVLTRSLAVVYLDREGTTWNGVCWRITEEPRELSLAQLVGSH